MSQLVSATQAAAIYGCSARYIQRIAQQGILPVREVRTIARAKHFPPQPTNFYDPMDVLKARQVSRLAPKAVALRTPQAQSKRAAANNRWLRLYYQMPIEARKGHGRGGWRGRVKAYYPAHLLTQRTA